MAENRAGIGESLPVNLTTPQSAPQGLHAPTWSSEDRNTITLRWKSPKKPNGQ